MGIFRFSSCLMIIFLFESLLSLVMSEIISVNESYLSFVTSAEFFFTELLSSLVTCYDLFLLFFPPQ